MSITFNARFETPDMADFALMRLRSNGIRPESLVITPVRRHFKPGIDDNTYDYGYGYARSGPANIIPTGNFAAYPSMAVPALPVRTDAERIAHDIISTEVRLEVSVPHKDASRTESVLVSCHGYNIRRS